MGGVICGKDSVDSVLYDGLMIPVCLVILLVIETQLNTNRIFSLEKIHKDLMLTRINCV
jgi:hypothetical protein